MTYRSPSSFDGVTTAEFRSIESIQWFSRNAVEEGVENEFGRLALYAWDGQSYWGVEVESLSSRMWRYMITVGDACISYHDRTQSNISRNVAEVSKGLLTLFSGPLLDANVFVDIWEQRNCSEDPYLENLCTLLQETLGP